MSLATVKISKDGRCLNLSGAITFDTVAALREKGSDLMQTVAEEIVFDFQGVERSDSSALALLSAWARAARKLNKNIQFINVHAQLMDIAKLSNLDKIITLIPSI